MQRAKRVTKLQVLKVLKEVNDHLKDKGRQMFLEQTTNMNSTKSYDLMAATWPGINSKQVLLKDHSIKDIFKHCEGALTGLQQLRIGENGTE